MSIFGTWFPFFRSYRIERLDDQEFNPIDFLRQVALKNTLAQYELYFQFDWEKRKPNSLAYFFQ